MRLALQKGSTGVLTLTEEEKRTLIAEGYPVPTKLPLTKQEEKSLKKVRRKIKNKVCKGNIVLYLKLFCVFEIKYWDSKLKLRMWRERYWFVRYVLQISAQESRRKKKEYMDGLERRVTMLTNENSSYRDRLNSLEDTNRELLKELQRLQALLQLQQS